MGSGYHGGFGDTIGARNNASEGLKRQSVQGQKHRNPIFSPKGHVTLESITDRAEFFLGKSLARIQYELGKYGYKTKRRDSKNKKSKARLIVTLNPNKDRNITQMQISPGSRRHGNVPYVKISTSDMGRIKIIGASKSEYKSDGDEKAHIFFRRKK